MAARVQIETFLSSLKAPDWDPGLAEYRHHLLALNEICNHVRATTGEHIEGNLICLAPHEYATLPDLPDQQLLAKRRNYATYIVTGVSLLEIGFNAGHSALIALTINPALTYSGIDLGHHAYTLPCFNYLKTVFGDRLNLEIGDSREILPTIFHSGHRYDLFHIDGGHSFGVAHADLASMIQFCRDGDVILFDDTDLEHLLLDELCDIYAIKGLVTRVQTSKLWSGNRHVLLRVNKPGR